MKSELVVFVLCEQTDRQTDRHTHHNSLHILRTPPVVEVV